MSRPYGGQHLLLCVRSELHGGKPQPERRQVTAEWHLHLHTRGVSHYIHCRV